MKYFIAVPAFAASLAAAATMTVTVGPGETYTPDSITAAEGDVIAFQFTNTEHNVVQGSFDNACQPSGDDAIYSDIPANADDIFSVTVNSTDPLYFYCSVPGHCEAGMVMAVNAPSSGNTLDAYRQAASSASGSSQPDQVQGGSYGGAASPSGSPSASESGSSMTMSGSATGSSTSAAASSTSSGNAGAVAGMSFAGAAAGLAAFLL